MIEFEKWGKIIPLLCNFFYLLSAKFIYPCYSPTHRFTSGSQISFIFACVCTFLFCLSFIFLTSIRKAIIKPKYNKKSPKEGDFSSITDLAPKNSPKSRIALAGIYFLQTLYAVIIMLLWMTYNGYVILTMCIGLTFGYFLFESKYEGVYN